MKRSIKTISLSIDELTQLLAIDDPATRQSIAEAVRTNAADETAPIECPSEPIAECLLGKIQKKREAAARRRQARERRRLEKAQCVSVEAVGNETGDAAVDFPMMSVAGKSLLEKVKNDSPQRMPFNSSVVANVLNVVYRQKKWFGYFFNLFGRLPDNSLIGQLVSQTKDSITYLESFLPRLHEIAKNYHSMPSDERPSEVWL